MFSAPFFTWCPDLKHDKTIMIVGQGANNWNVDGATVEEIRALVEAYYTSGRKSNSSPFWEAFTSFEKCNYNTVWNNIDKYHSVEEGRKIGPQLHCEEEKALHESFNDTNKSLFLQEVETIQPSIVLFVTGPSYYQSICWAMGIPPEKTQQFKTDFAPSCNNDDSWLRYIHLEDYNVHINSPNTPAFFWTYHPNFLKLNKAKNENYSPYGRIERLPALIESCMATAEHNL